MLKQEEGEKVSKRNRWSNGIKAFLNFLNRLRHPTQPPSPSSTAEIGKIVSTGDKNGPKKPVPPLSREEIAAAQKGEELELEEENHKPETPDEFLVAQGRRSSQDRKLSNEAKRKQKEEQLKEEQKRARKELEEGTPTDKRWQNTHTLVQTEHGPEFIKKIETTLSKEEKAEVEQQLVKRLTSAENIAKMKNEQEKQRAIEAAKSRMDQERVALQDKITELEKVLANFKKQQSVLAYVQGKEMNYLNKASAERVAPPLLSEVLGETQEIEKTLPEKRADTGLNI